MEITNNYIADLNDQRLKAAVIGGLWAISNNTDTLSEQTTKNVVKVERKKKKSDAEGGC